MLSHEAPETHVESEIIAQGPTTKIVRLTIPSGESLPTHSAKMKVAVAVLSGEGRITVSGRAINAEPGALVEVAPGEPHAVYADQELEILVVQTGT